MLSEELSGSTTLVVVAWFVGGAVGASVVERDQGILILSLLALGIYHAVTAEMNQ